MTGCLCILPPFHSVPVLCSLPGVLKTITKARGQMSEQSRLLKGLPTQSTLLVPIISIEKVYNQDLQSHLHPPMRNYRQHP